MITVRFVDIQWFDEHPVATVDGSDAYPGCDGMARYQVVVDGEDTMPMNQPFARGPSREIFVHGAKQNVWGWDGNRVAPTLTPSYRCKFPWKGTNFDVHLYLTAGRLDLQGDSFPPMKAA